MIPRGEVGLILAGMGTTLTLPNSQGVLVPVVGAATFGAAVTMIIATTLVTPPLLKWSLERRTAPKPSEPKGVDEIITDQSEANTATADL